MYVEDCSKIYAEITKIDEMMGKLNDALLGSLSNADLQEYFQNTGQTTTKVVYRDPVQINASMLALERRKQLLINKLNGFGKRAVDIKNFNPRI